jgi:hypothetical protein
MARNVPLIVSSYNISEQLYAMLPAQNRQLQQMLSSYLWEHATLAIDNAELVLNHYQSALPNTSNAADSTNAAVTTVRRLRSFRAAASDLRLRVEAKLLLPRLREFESNLNSSIANQTSEANGRAFLSTVYAVDKVEYIDADGYTQHEIDVSHII